MKISKYAVSTSLAITGLILSSITFAMPGFSEQAPESSIKICVAQIGERANYEGAGRVRHEVDSIKRRVSGHKITIDTKVFGADGGEVIREYATVCSITDDSETKRFKFREKSI